MEVSYVNLDPVGGSEGEAAAESHVVHDKAHVAHVLVIQVVLGNLEASADCQARQNIRFDTAQEFVGAFGVLFLVARQVGVPVEPVAVTGADAEVVEEGVGQAHVNRGGNVAV